MLTVHSRDFTLWHESGMQHSSVKASCLVSALIFFTSALTWAMAQRWMLEHHLTAQLLLAHL